MYVENFYLRNKDYYKQFVIEIHDITNYNIGNL